eukprot:Mycagemm_TRINITY_DN10694_c0_g1::TRINITY_DN10694_c0_g1_i1::g.4980::m.4980 type:complete len:120 gc:universal TRINITY_DN10694_c0_g1_i1:388-29(-)
MLQHLKLYQLLLASCRLCCACKRTVRKTFSAQLLQYRCFACTNTVKNSFYLFPVPVFNGIKLYQLRFGKLQRVLQVIPHSILAVILFGRFCFLFTEQHQADGSNIGYQQNGNDDDEGFI